MQIAGAIVDNCNAHLCPPGSGKRPMTSDGDGAPRRTGVEYFDSVAEAEGASAARFCHSEKNRRSAFSVSSATTKPSVVQPRRFRVHLQMLEASNPISSAISNVTVNGQVEGARAKANAKLSAPYPTTTTSRT